MNFKKKSYHIETCWEELSPEKFCNVAAVLLNSMKEPVQQVRLKILHVLTDKQFTNERAGCKQKLAELTHWIFDVSMNADILNILSPGLCDVLLYCLPEEVDANNLIPELEQVYSLLQPTLKINLKINRNLVPFIAINGKKYYGPVFNIDKNGVVETDLTAGEFLDATEYLNLFAQTGDVKYMETVTACLFRADRSKYSTFAAQKQSSLFKNNAALPAIWMMFVSWQHYFSTHPVFGILFSQTDDTSIVKKISLGSYELIYSFAKDGYGSIDSLTSMMVIDFFSLQVKAIKDAVNQYRSMEKKDGEISKMLKIPFDTIIKL